MVCSRNLSTAQKRREIRGTLANFSGFAPTPGPAKVSKAPAIISPTFPGVKALMLAGGTLIATRCCWQRRARHWSHSQGHVEEARIGRENIFTHCYWGE